jgi:peptidoglycan hydrolase-like protein with peptidoglycan-binding domain
VLEVQGLIHELDYPLTRGRYGTRTRGAIAYFQRKYGLPVSGYPNVRTIARMRMVVSSLRGPGAAGGSGAGAQRPARDLVEGLVGNLPVTAIALALALLMCALAPSAWRRPVAPRRG